MKKILFVFLIGIISQSCITTYYGTAPKKIETEIEEFTVFWNSFCKEKQVLAKYELEINRLIKNSELYDTCLILYQSNNSIKYGARKYVVRFFKSKEDSKQFTKMTDEKIKAIETFIKSESFNNSWGKLSYGLEVEDVFSLFPEFNDFYLKNDFKYEEAMIYKIQGVKFVFNNYGELMYWEK